MPPVPKGQPAPVEDVEAVEEVVDDRVEDIEVPEDTADPASKKTIDLDEEDAVEAEMKTLTNQKFAAMRKEAADAKRQSAELQKKIKEYEARQSAPVQAAPQIVPNGRPRQMYGDTPIPETRAEWDALARKDYLLMMDIHSHLRTQAAIQNVRTQERQSSALEESKQRVLEKHPELADPTSDKGKIFLRILDKNPEYLTLSKGPIFAMRDMEEEMEAAGYSREEIFETKKTLARAETTRINRGALTGGGRMPEKTGRTVQLSADDMEFCKTQGLDPKDYAKEKLAMEKNRKGAQL